MATALVVTFVLAGCGDDSPGPTPTLGGVARAATGTAITSNGSYRVDLSVGPEASGSQPVPCAPTVASGSSTLPVSVTVVNLSADQPAPFPPLRVELITGGSPAQVRVQGSAGTCTFTPQEPALQPQGAASFAGATPAIAEGTQPGRGGTVQVSLSESDFSVSVPVP